MKLKIYCFLNKDCKELHGHNKYERKRKKKRNEKRGQLITLL
jgi:hypothetical protein